VAVVYTPYFKNTKVNGAVRWVGDKPTIQLNVRGAYGDIFWFTFFHEVGHLVLHGVKDEFVDYSGRENDEKEREADNFASAHLVPESAYQALISAPLTRASIIAASEKIGVHESIVMGRLAHEGRLSWSSIASHRPKLKFVDD
jgi:HTH-type transcriptional regulator/antitoxin HigA